MVPEINVVLERFRRAMAGNEALQNVLFWHSLQWKYPIYC